MRGRRSSIARRTTSQNATNASASDFAWPMESNLPSTNSPISNTRPVAGDNAALPTNSSHAVFRYSLCFACTVSGFHRLSQVAANSSGVFS